MTDKEYKQQKARVEKILNKWRRILGLDGHRFHFNYVREYDDVKSAVASINALWQYKNHSINIFLPKVAEIDSDYELTEALVHEFVHVFINPFQKEDPTKAEEEILEFATQSITYAILWAYEEGKHEKQT